jgi:uncharacterized protein YrrD
MRRRHGTTSGGGRSTVDAVSIITAQLLEATVIRSVSEMHNFELVATDGRIGTVDDCFFDDDRWAIRYVVVGAGLCLPRHRMLISPISVRRIEWRERRLLLWSTRHQIEHSPRIDTRQTVSRHHEMDYLDYYGYPYYWGHSDLWGTHALPVPPTSEQSARHRKRAANPERRAADRGLTRMRSASEITGYAIRAADGEVGHVEDCLFDDVSWAVEYLVVNANTWSRSEHVLVAPTWVTSITSAEDSVGALISGRPA